MHVLLVHGAGLGPASFEVLLERLWTRGITATAPTRRGYDGRSATDRLDQHVDDVVEHVEALADRHRRVVVAGVSGGATLTLALAASGHPGVTAAVVHEPLVGVLARDQHERITDSIAEFAADATPTAIDHFLERLVTPSTWAALPDTWRRDAREHDHTVRVESAGFASFALDRTALARAAATTTWTVGSRSPSWRLDAAAVGAAVGIAVETVTCAHTPQFEAPDAWVDVIERAGAHR